MVTESFTAEDLEAGSGAALDSLSRAGTRAPALIDAWVERQNVNALQAAADAPQGVWRKAARRALNVLRARGVTVAERPKQKRLVTPEAATFEAWMLSPDSSGTLLLVVASRSRASRYRSVFVALNDAVGVLDMSVGEVSQSQLKDRLRRAAPQPDLKPTRVPLEWARARVARARSTHAERGTVEPLGFVAAQALLGPVPETRVEHPLDAEGLDMSLDDARETAKGSATLHALPEFRTWLPPRPAVDEMLEKVGERVAPGEQPDANSFQGLLADEVKNATDRFFSPEHRSRLLGWMKDGALSVLARDGEAAALRVVATMKAVENAGLITDPPSDIPFLRGFFDKAVAVLSAQGGGSIRVPVARAQNPAEADEPAAVAAAPEPEPSP